MGEPHLWKPPYTHKRNTNCLPWYLHDLQSHPGQKTSSHIFGRQCSRPSPSPCWSSWANKNRWDSIGGVSIATEIFLIGIDRHIGVYINGGTANRWMAYNGKYIFKWMMTGGTPISGNSYIGIWTSGFTKTVFLSVDIIVKNDMLIHFECTQCTHAVYKLSSHFHNINHCS